MPKTPYPVKTPSLTVTQVLQDMRACCIQAYLMEVVAEASQVSPWRTHSTIRWQCSVLLKVVRQLFQGCHKVCQLVTPS